jgi:hypothetical protein
MTHLEFPWKKARQGLSSEARSTQPILIEDMKALGYQKLEVIERDHPAYEPVMYEVLKDTITSVNNQSEPSNLIHKGEVRDWINSLLN